MVMKIQVSSVKRHGSVLYSENIYNIIYSIKMFVFKLNHEFLCVHYKYNIKHQHTNRRITHIKKSALVF